MPKIDYLITIEPVNSNYSDVPDIGMQAGIINWCTDYVGSLTSTNSQNNILVENWGGSSSRTANVQRGGGLASIGGGAIRIKPNASVMETLDALNISLYMALIKISLYVDGVSVGDLRNGQIVKVQSSLKDVLITYEDLSRAYNVGLNLTAPNGESLPVSYGASSDAPTVKVESSIAQPSLGVDSVGTERHAIFQVVFNEYIDYVQIKALEDMTFADFEGYFDSLTASIASGIETVTVVQGSKKRLISSFNAVDFGTGYTGYIAECYYVGSGEKADQIVLSGSDKNLYATFEINSKNFYYDNFESATIVSPKLDTIVDGEYTRLPTIIEGLSFESGRVAINDPDGKGWENVISSESDINVLGGATGIQGYTGAGTPPTPTLTGTLANMIDGDSSTSTSYAVGADGATDYEFHQIQLFYQVNIPANYYDKLSLSVVMSLDELDYDGWTGSGFVSVFAGAGATVSYPWGTNSNVPYNNYIDPASVPTIVAEYPEPYYYSNSPSGSDYQPFFWAKNDTGYDATDINYATDIDYSTLIESYTSTDNSGSHFLIGAVMSFLNTELNVRRVKISVKDLRMMGLRSFGSDDIFVDHEGRKDKSSVVITETKTMYENVLRLQNYENSEVFIVPTLGWGKAYPHLLTSDDRTDLTSSYGGMGYSGVPAYEVGRSYTNDIDTNTLKAEMLNEMYCMGAIGRNGREKIFPLIEALYDELGGTLITLDMLPKGQFPKVVDRSYNDIFVEPNVRYAYDAGLESYGSRITITNTEQPSASDTQIRSWVTGLSDSKYTDGTARNLWEQGNMLYKVYGIKNPFPEKLGDLGLLTDEDDAIEYVTNVYKWCGITIEDGEYTGRKRYTTSFKIPLVDAVQNDLDIGSRLRLQIPNLTYDVSLPAAAHTGIITAITDEIGGKNPFTTIKAEMLGNNLAGSNVYKIVETGSATDVIIETGTRTFRYIEV